MEVKGQALKARNIVITHFNFALSALEECGGTLTQAVGLGYRISRRWRCKATVNDFLCKAPPEGQAKSGRMVRSISMKVKVGIMGSAGDAAARDKDALWEKAVSLTEGLAAREPVLLTGATTGIVYVAGKAAHDAGIFHVGISPAGDSLEHVEKYKLPLDACDVIIYTGFGLKGRNVVLVRSCDVVLFIAGAMGSLNEFTIAHDEGKVIGCLTGTGGVADEVDYLLQKFSKKTGGRVFQSEDPEKLLDSCWAKFHNRA